MAAFEPACQAAALGSLPMTDPRVACSLALKYFPSVPMWPQLPRLSFRENMYAQYSEGLPGVVLGDESIHVDRARAEQELETLYLAYLSDDASTVGRISRPYAEGLAMMLALKPSLTGALAIKGQVTGPISLGLQVTDTARRPILYDEIMADAVAKLLRMKASWQEAQLRKLCPRTVIFVDEPYLASFGSAYVPVYREQVVSSLEEVFGGIQGLKGLHCCGNTDWGMLLDTSVDIVSFDAYHYAIPFGIYAGQIKEFLRRGGVIAWGIVPNETELLGPDGETVDSLTQRLAEAMDLLVQKGISRDVLLQQALVTASCGLGTLPVETAIRACELTSAVAQRMHEMAGGR